MQTIGLVLATLAAVLHVYIWALESLVFATKGRKVFGLTAEQAGQVRQWAYNQGFYNLFLAVITFVGVGLAICPAEDADVASMALVTAGTASMLGAALVLVTNDRTAVRPALVQGTLPFLALLVTGLGCL